MESVETRLARIEEHQVFMRGELKGMKNGLDTLLSNSQTSATEIALMKRDAKWRSRIVAGTGGIFGAIAALLVNWFSMKRS
jgi:hypothetical protein